MTINDTSITKFERSKLINRVFGNSIKNTFKIQELEFKNDENYIGCLVSHNGYEKDFSCTHKREIYLDHKNNYLIIWISYFTLSDSSLFKGGIP